MTTDPRSPAEWEPTPDGRCPRCGEAGLWRDSADVGVGVIYGPWGCQCGWSESTEYDASLSGGWQESGAYTDPYGGLWPAESDVVRHMRAAEQTESRTDSDKRRNDTHCDSGGAEADDGAGGPADPPTEGVQD